MPSALRRRIVATLATLATTGLLAGTVAAGHSTAAPVKAKAVSATKLGVYVGPGAKNVVGAAAFSQWAGQRVTNVVDFPPTTAWTSHSGLTGPSWLLAPYTNSGLRLEYSLPMLPDIASTNLADCAAGQYDQYWTETGANLMKYGLADTVVRPGWEMNGNWYRWSAGGKVEAYVGCFRRIVTAMRATPGNAFTFDWTVNNGLGTFAAEQAYPGDAYVDFVGVDAYDSSWSVYPIPSGMSQATAAAKAWDWTLNGDHGLAFWKSLAAVHGKPLTVPEWGATIRTDGHGGGDNPYFIDRMLDFLTDPANNVAFAHYFNIDAGMMRHDLIKPGSLFPTAGQRYRERIAGLTAPAPIPNTGAPAPAPAVAKPAISLTASTTKLTAGGAATLTAYAVRTLGKTVTPLVNGTVTLQASVNGGVYATVTTGRTAADGKAIFTVKPIAHTSYRATITDAGTTAVATQLVSVAYKVSNALTGASVRRNVKVVLSASVGPKPVKGTRVQVERLVNGTWSTAAQVLTDSTGLAKWRPSTKAAGSFTYRVRVLAAGHLGSGVGETMALRVR